MDDSCWESSDYEILAEIGQGSYGKVYKARERREQQRLIAVKRLNIPEEPESGIPQFVIREVALLRKIEHFNHPNIVKWVWKRSNTREVLWVFSLRALWHLSLGCWMFQLDGRTRSLTWHWCLSTSIKTWPHFSAEHQRKAWPGTKSRFELCSSHFAVTIFHIQYNNKEETRSSWHLFSQGMCRCENQFLYRHITKKSFSAQEKTFQWTCNMSHIEITA